jgi:hypothetical protein
MFTKAKNKKTNEIITFRSQQYEIGTYLIINDKSSEQMTLDITEQELHKKIRNDKNLEIIETY